jgi:hypothetical protein
MIFVKPGPGRSKLFHAIVLVGTGLFGGCSKGPLVATDAAADAASDADADAGAGRDGPGPDTGIMLDAAASDGSGDSRPDQICYCNMDGGPACGACSCDCLRNVEAGACFPCYV